MRWLAVVLPATIALLAWILASLVPPPLEPRAVAPVLVPETGPATPLRERIGINVVYANAPADVAQVAGWVRDYHRWYWYEPDRGQLVWATSKQQLDYFYSTLNGLGVQILVSVGMVPAWWSSTGKTDGLPYPGGSSGSDIADYEAHAQYVAEVAARYGATRHESGVLRSSDGISGMGWVQAIEGWNEPNQNWVDPRFPPSHFARMQEADFDGTGLPRGAGSPLAGVKQGDPGMAVVLPGLAGPDVGYLGEAMVQRSDPNRLPFDVLNFHWFAKGDPEMGGRAPEAADLTNALATMRRWRDTNAPGTPIWLTEMGWDTNSRAHGRHSNLYAPEPTAANYLVRAAMIALAEGADKVFVFAYRDHDSTSPALYSTSGLVENSSAWEGGDARKKAGWYYLATIKDVLGGMVVRSADRQGDGDPAVYQYRLSEADGARQAVVAWTRNPLASRDDGTTISGYEIRMPGALRAELVQLVAGSATGSRSEIRLRDAGKDSAGVRLHLSETPIIVQYWTR